VIFPAKNIVAHNLIFLKVFNDNLYYEDIVSTMLGNSIVSK